VEYLVIAALFGLATGLIGRAKGSSFFIWFLVPMFNSISMALWICFMNDGNSIFQVRNMILN